METDTTQRGAGLANRVHDFAQQGSVVDLLACEQPVGQFAATLQGFPFESFDFVDGQFAEVLVQRIAGFQLFAVDQHGVGAR